MVFKVLRQLDKLYSKIVDKQKLKRFSLTQLHIPILEGGGSGRFPIHQLIQGYVLTIHYYHQKSWVGLIRQDILFCIWK